MNESINSIVEELLAIEIETSEERGQYDLFALFLREDAADRWDMVVAADWIYRITRRQALQYLTEKLQQRLSVDQVSLIARIVITEKSDLMFLRKALPMSISHSSTLVNKCWFNSLFIEHAYFFSFNPYPL